jgi:glutaminyl-tRNA synthetase
MAPPKGTSANTAAYIDLFTSIGLTQAKASEAAKSAKSAGLLQSLIERHALTGGRIDEKQAGLVAALAIQGAKIGEDEQGYVVNAIIDGRLKSTDQVNGASQRFRDGSFPDTSKLTLTHTAAIKFLETHPLPVDDVQFDSECGVGQFRTECPARMTYLIMHNS